MRPIEKTVTGVAATDWLPMDYHRDPFNVGIGVSIPAGTTAVYTVQHTFVPVPGLLSGRVPTSDEIFNHETLAGLSASDDGNYAFPVSAVRLNVTASDGSVDVIFTQAGIRGG